MFPPLQCFSIADNAGELQVSHTARWSRAVWGKKIELLAKITSVKTLHLMHPVIYNHANKAPVKGCQHYKIPAASKYLQILPNLLQAVFSRTWFCRCICRDRSPGWSCTVTVGNTCRVRGVFFIYITLFFPCKIICKTLCSTTTVKAQRSYSMV